ncbi:MAG: trehalose-6-phosphate synthase, partial [Myxococcales bacterium]|nr:trehalose-6-phosphate synthase [Myxococcales bacterium]
HALAAASIAAFLALGGALATSIAGPGASSAVDSPVATSSQAGLLPELRRAASALEETLVIASNRGPVTFAEQGGELVSSRAGGGLATGLAPLVEHNDRVQWIASAVSGADLRAAKSNAQVPEFNLGYVTMDPARYNLAYNKISNEILWYLSHGFWDGLTTPRFEGGWRKAWDAYRELNRRFSDAIGSAAPQGSAVLVQDYHLSLVGDMLKQDRPDLRTVHFTHTPFSGPEEFGRLPDLIQEDLLKGMAGFGACGFHTGRWARRFGQTCDEFLGHTPETFVAPLGVDPASVRKVAHSQEADRWAKEIRARAGDRQIIGRTDRIELSKNILTGFEAYDDLLQHNPDLRNKVSFVASIFPSRTDVDDYVAYTERVKAKAAEINRRYGTADWEPIILYTEDNNYARGMAVLRESDVVLVNPVRDGLNLVAKETAIVGERNPTLVLSREAGFYDELKAAGSEDSVLGINPFDVEQTTQALRDALTLSPEQRVARTSRLRAAVEGRSPRDWLDDQLTAARH